MSAAGRARAHGWVDHLRRGGTTPWPDWTDDSTRASGALPGAQQLELLRRLNLMGPPDAALVERVLAASAPGRGTPDLELLGADSGSDFGPRPVDPTTLPPDELIRVATSLIAEDLVRVGTPTTPAPRLVAVRRRLAPTYRLVGDPWTTPLIRADLSRQGWTPGGRDAAVYVLATDAATMLTRTWTARSFGEGAPAWRDWLDPLIHRDEFPPRADLARIVQRHDSPEIVLDPSALPDLLHRKARPRPRIPTPPIPTANAAETARRVGAPLALLVPPARRRDLLTRTLLPRLADTPGRPLRLPDPAVAWATAWGEKTVQAIRTGGYRVHGDLRDLLPGAVDGVASPKPGEVLTLVLGVLLDPAVGPERMQA